MAANKRQIGEKSKMLSSLILIRGNSGSGKSTLAQKLQQFLGTESCLLLQQDKLRRNLLHADDHIASPAVDLLDTLLKFGSQHYSLTILEGILRKDVYGEMLKQAMIYFNDQKLIYYLDYSFEKTVSFNSLKEQPFSVTLLQKWWREQDYLTANDRLLNGNLESNYQKIINDLQ